MTLPLIVGANLLTNRRVLPLSLSIRHLLSFSPIKVAPISYYPVGFLVYNFSASLVSSTPFASLSIPPALLDRLPPPLARLLLESTSMPGYGNFLNQTFATEQFVALTSLRRGAPRRARARLRPSAAAPLGRGYDSRLNPIKSQARGEKENY